MLIEALILNTFSKQLGAPERQFATPAGGAKRQMGGAAPDVQSPGQRVIVTVVTTRSVAQDVLRIPDVSGHLD